MRRTIFMCGADSAAAILLISIVPLFCSTCTTVRAQMPFDVNPFAPGIPGVPVFDPDIDNIDSRGGVVASAIFAYLPSLSPDFTFGDASLVIWISAIRLATQFDATAPFHPTAVGIHTRLPRQQTPSEEDEMRVFNTAVLHATYHMFLHLWPAFEPEWRMMMNLTGLDADDESLCSMEDTVCSPEAVGNTAGLGMVESRMFTDGFNWDGLMARKGPYFPITASDYTGYQAVNSAFDLQDAARWQPTITQQQVGVYKIQQFVTPQWALTEPYAPGSAETVEFDVPAASDPENEEMYRAQADAVLAASAELTEESKMKAEFFDNKGLIFGAVFPPLAEAAGLGPFERLHAEFIEAAAAHDAGVAVWRAKHKYDAVRPFSAIRSLYANQSVTAYGGPGVGTVHDLPGEDWQSYISTADHPEFPSATACFCAAVAEGWRLYFGTDEFNSTFTWNAGTSFREPGITPAAALPLFFPTLTQYTEDCAVSRIDAGTHFPFAAEQSLEQCPKIGGAVHDWVARLVAGTEPPRPPAMGLPVSSLPETVGPYSAATSD